MFRIGIKGTVKGSIKTLHGRPFVRHYARHDYDSPFDHLRREKGWINWKTSLLFFFGGAALAYNQTLFNVYEKLTAIDVKSKDNTDLLPMQLEYKLKHLPLYEELTHPKNLEKWAKLESWENLDHDVIGKRTTVVRKQNEYTGETLTTQTLRQPGGVLIKPVIFHNVETDEGVTIVHVGYRLCGYPLMVHGGMIATLLNETFKRNALLAHTTKSALKDDFMVENLTVNYKAPTFANQFLVIKTKRTESKLNDEKNIALESVIEDSKGKVLVKGSAVLRDTGRATDAGFVSKSWFSR